MNTFGTSLRLTTFGESHGPAIGGVIDGYPAGVKIDFKLIECRLSERRPGQPGTTPRKEPDAPEFLSGISADGVSLGTPIGFIIRNTNTRASDYALLKENYRPNHADYTYMVRYGIRDFRGGGRASARETACRVVAGALAEQLLLTKGIKVEAMLTEVGGVSGSREVLMEQVEKARQERDSVGGTVSCEITGVPAGLGNPVYGKLSALLASAMMSINAAKGVEIGDGFDLASRKGSEVIDEFTMCEDAGMRTRTNHSGGVQGGISNGMPVKLRVAFKPTPTIGKPLPLINGRGESCMAVLPGRHDPCVAVRAVPVVRAMACIVISDLLLQSGF